MAAGRKTKFTDDTRNGIYDALRKGATYKGACAAVGISEETFRKWRNKGEQIAKGEIKRRKSNEEFEQFYLGIDAARQESFNEARKAILEAGKKDWKAYEKYLAANDPEWGKDKNVNVKVKSEQKLDDNQFDKAISELANAIGEILPRESKK